MSISLTRVARKFALILSKTAADPMEDLLLKHPNSMEDMYVDPEMTEELDGIVKDSLHLVILMQRAFSDFLKICEAAGGSKDLGLDLAEKVLFELQEVETNLQNSSLLQFNVNMEDSILHTIAEDISMIQRVLELVKPYPGAKVPASFRDLDQKVFSWLLELEENIASIADKAFGQSDFIEQIFAEPKSQMSEQIDEDVDEISREDIHPDHPDFAPEFDIAEREINPEGKWEHKEERPINSLLTGYGPLSRDYEPSDDELEEADEEASLSSLKNDWTQDIFQKQKEEEVASQFDQAGDLLQKNKTFHAK